jgi:hypothetical protein
VHGEAPRERRLWELDAQARAGVSRYVAELVAATADGHALAAGGGVCGLGVGAGGGRCGKGGRVVVVDEEAGGVGLPPVGSITSFLPPSGTWMRK